MLRKTLVTGSLALALVVALSTASKATISSWISSVDAVGGGFTKTNADISLMNGESGSLYLWLENTVQLRSVAYDLAAATPGIINITGAEVYTPDLLAGGTPIGSRWNLPVQNGTVAGDSQSITNVSAVNVDKAGLTVATRTFDELWDATASAALFAKINFDAIGLGTTALTLTEGLTKMVEAGNTSAPELNFGGGMITVMGDPPTVSVDDLALTNDILGGSVSGIVTGTDVETWEETLEFVSYVPGYGAGPAAEGTTPAIAATWNASTQSFDWDTTGSYPGDYLWRVTGSNGDASDTGDISVAHRIPEPATLSLFGLALVGFVSAARRRS